MRFCKLRYEDLNYPDKGSENMNYVPLMAIPFISDWRGLNALQYHPDFLGTYMGGIADLRENYLPARSYGSKYIPFVVPVIATMPGLFEKSEKAYFFFRKREVFLLDSSRFTYNMINRTACLAGAIFCTTLAYSFVCVAGVVALYLVVTKIIEGHYQTEADEYVLKHATPEQLAAAMGFIIALQEKAKEKPNIHVFKILFEKLEKAHVQAVRMPDDIFAEYEERKSTMGLAYTMRPYRGSMDPEIQAVFFEREMFHYNLENSELLKVVAGIGFVCVISVAAPASFFFSPLVYVAGAAYMYGLPSPIAIKTKSQDLLYVSFEFNNGLFQKITLTGAAERVFYGQFPLIRTPSFAYN
jgi:hypothetical protein